MKLRNYLVWVYVIFLQSENLLNTLSQSTVISLNEGVGRENILNTKEQIWL